MQSEGGKKFVSACLSVSLVLGYLFFPREFQETPINRLDWFGLLVVISIGYLLIFRPKIFGSYGNDLLLTFVLFSTVFFHKFVLNIHSLL